MVADVPVGVLLSGGLDSSLVVALLADEGQVGLKTFSVGFHATGGESGDEFEYSDLIAEHFGTDHQQILVDPARMLPAVDDTIAAMAEPMVSHDCVAFYLLSEEVAKSVKVVQSGQGADEVFAGYDWYPPLAAVPRERGVDGLRRGVHRPPARRAGRRSWSRSGCSTTTRAGRSSPSTSPHPAPSETLDAALRLDSTIMLVDDPVKRVDNMTMAWGLEARVPFLDHELVELAAACPPELKLAHGGKGVLKEAARGVVPDEVIDRPKGYFPVPAIRHLEGPFLDRVRDAVTDPVAKARGPGPRRLAGRDAGRPEHPAHQPGFERVVAGSAAGDVAAGEGVVTMGVRETVGFTERRLARLGLADAFATAYSDPIPSPDGALLGWISDRDGRPQVFVAPAAGRTAGRSPSPSSR